jgi:hypothetical protein
MHGEGAPRPVKVHACGAVNDGEKNDLIEANAVSVIVASVLAQDDPVIWFPLVKKKGTAGRHSAGLGPG